MGSIFLRGWPRFLEPAVWTGCGIEILVADLEMFFFKLFLAVGLFMYLSSCFADIHCSSIRAKSVVNSVDTSSIHCEGSCSDSAVSENRSRKG